MKKKRLVVEKTMENRATSLPDDFAAQLGQLICRWSNLEDTTKSIIYELIGVSDVVGRLVVGVGRIEDQITKIEDLNTTLGFRFDPPLTALKTELSNLETERNTFAHCVWITRQSDALYFQDLNKKWGVNIGKDTPRITRRMYPEVVLIQKDRLQKLIERMDAVLPQLNGLHKAIRARRSSPEKRR
jgi:hypothetical protein